MALISGVDSHILILVWKQPPISDAKAEYG